MKVETLFSPETLVNMYQTRRSKQQTRNMNLRLSENFIFHAKVSYITFLSTHFSFPKRKEAKTIKNSFEAKCDIPKAVDMTQYWIGEHSENRSSTFLQKEKNHQLRVNYTKLSGICSLLMRLSSNTILLDKSQHNRLVINEPILFH